VVPLNFPWITHRKPFLQVDLRSFRIEFRHLSGEGEEKGEGERGEESGVRRGGKRVESG
jgi:hypothetical protein